MEDLLTLVTACKHLSHEARDQTVARLQKQKHAAHAINHRLRLKIR